MKTGFPLAEVEYAPYFGRHFPFVPWSYSTELRVSWVFVCRLISELGAARFVVFWALLPCRLAFLLRHNSAGLHLMDKKFGRMAGLGWSFVLTARPETAVDPDKESNSSLRELCGSRGARQMVRQTAPRFDQAAEHSLAATTRD